MKVRNLSFSVLVCVCILLLFGCNQPTVTNANTQLSPAPANIEVTNTQPVPKPPVNSEVKPESKKYGVLTSNPEELNASFELKGGLKYDLYQTVYSSKVNHKDEVRILIGSSEGEVIIVIVQLVPLSKGVIMARMPEKLKSPGTAVSDHKGIIGMRKDSQVTKCLNGAQKIIDIYETDLKSPAETALISFWLNDCGNLPVGFLMPMGGADINSLIEDFEI